MTGYLLTPARDGGFLVASAVLNSGVATEILYAGGLDDCLVYLRDKLAPEAELPLGEVAMSVSTVADRTEALAAVPRPKRTYKRRRP